MRMLLIAMFVAVEWRANIGVPQKRKEWTSNTWDIRSNGI